MSWNYRVLHRLVPVPEHMRAAVGRDHDETFAVHEVYYDEQGEPMSCSANPDPIMAESLRELQEVKMMMVAALRKPVLEWTLFEDKKPGQPKGQWGGRIIP